MSSVGTVKPELEYAVSSKLKLSVGGSLGSIHQLNAGTEYRVTPTTSLSYKTQYWMYENEEDKSLAHCFTLHERLTKDFSFFIMYRRGVSHELRLKGIRELQVMSSIGD